MDENNIREISYRLVEQNALQRLQTIINLKESGIDDLTDISFDFMDSSFNAYPARIDFGTYSICPLCDYSKTLILNSDCLTNKIIDVKPVAVLDLNIISNINKAMRKQEYPNSVDGINLCKLMHYLMIHKFYFVLSPALGERAVKTGETKDYIQNDMINNFLKYINLNDKSNLKQNDMLSTDEIKYKQKLFDSSIKYRNECFMTGLDRHYLSILCLVTKAFIIKFIDKPKNPVQELYNYCLSTLVYLDPEITSISMWLQNDNRANKIFKKLQPSSKDIIENIKNQSWDIYHLRLAESWFCYERGVASPDLIQLPYFVCRDNGLIQYFCLNPIIKFIVANGKIYPIRKYSIKDFELPYSDDDNIVTKKQKIKSFDLEAEKNRLFDIIKKR